MAKITEMLESKYMKQSDVEDGEAIVTVAKIGKGNIAREDEEPEYKWMVRFKEFSKPMILNSTNIQLLSKACASDDTDDWIGQQVVLYVDENVTYGGKLVGGLRIRALRKHKPAPAKTSPDPDPANGDDMPDDIPF